MNFAFQAKTDPSSLNILMETRYALRGRNKRQTNHITYKKRYSSFNIIGTVQGKNQTGKLVMSLIS